MRLEGRGHIIKYYQHFAKKLEPYFSLFITQSVLDYATVKIPKLET